MKKRKVLLLEPNYRNKYPPMGLMKLAMYHRLLKDDVVFYKGDLSMFVLNEVTNDAIKKLLEINKDTRWRRFMPDIRVFIKSGKIAPASEFEKTMELPFVRKWMEHFRKYHRSDAYFTKPRFDRVCVTTLFTFHWDITLGTIEFAKRICKKPNEVWVGGILASLVGDKLLEKIQGISLHKGSLNHVNFPGDKRPLPRPFGKIVIDALPLDYSILEEIDYKYPATDGYYAYATRGCIRRCSFCAVPTLEPKYHEYIPLKKRLQQTNARFGEQRNLLLMDNNAFASAKFETIIDEIYDSGFAKGATFVPPNKLDIAAQQLLTGWNERAYIRMAVRLLNEFVGNLEGERHDHAYSILLKYDLLHDYTATKVNTLLAYHELKDEYEKLRRKKPVTRFIDFNQGMDARLATPERMAKLATVAIRPLRIAFDHWAGRVEYVKAIRLASDSGITHMSNYLLYNFRDKPIGLYHRLRINIDLCDLLDVDIYSFPMKYHPIMDEKWFSNRDYIGNFWTRKGIRAIQAVLGSTAGKIGRGRTFFFKAFGRSEAEFEELLRMPEALIIKRWDAEIGALTEKWRTSYSTLAGDERAFVDGIVNKNIFLPEDWRGKSKVVQKVLEFYLLQPEDIATVDEGLKKQRIKDFAGTCPKDFLPDVLESAD